MGYPSGLPAAPQALESRRGVTAGRVESEQSGVVVQAEHQGVNLEGELVGVGVGAQVTQLDRLRDGLLQFDAPTDRKTVVSGQSVYVSVDIGGRRQIKTKTNTVN